MSIPLPQVPSQQLARVMPCGGFATTGVSERAALSVPTFVWKYRTLMGGGRIAQQGIRGLEG